MLETILQEYIDKPTTGCSMKIWIDSKDAKVGEYFARLQGKEGLNHTELYEKITRVEDLPFKFTTFKTHLRGKCTCPKS